MLRSAIRLLLTLLVLCRCARGADGDGSTQPLSPGEFIGLWSEFEKKPAVVRGTITAFWGSPFFIQDESGALYIHSSRPRGTLRIGDLVEVRGLARPGEITPSIEMQEVKVLGPGTQPPVRDIGAAEALSGNFDATLVRIRGTVEKRKGPFGADRSTLLRDEGTSFAAEFIGAPDGLPWPRLLPGEIVEASGILSVRGPDDPSPVPLRILVRSHRDIAVVAPQPWWMPPRLYWSIGAAGLALAACGTAAFALRRRARRNADKLPENTAHGSAADQRYRELFANATDIILTHDLEGKITSFNPAGERLLGWRADEIAGRNIADIFSGGHLGSGGIEPPPQTNGHENPGVFRGDLRTRAGGRVPVEVSSWIESRDGKPIGRQAICRDITERVRAEEARADFDRKLQETQKLESLGVLAGGVAHDFNNLLTSILGNASLAQMDAPKDSPLRPSLEQIEIAAERAADLCKQMLAYSGQGRFVVKRHDLSAIVRETSELLRVSAARKADLALHLAENMPAAIGDATQLRQVVMNLVINAAEALGENHGTITITTGTMHASRDYLANTHLSPELPEGEYVFLEIADTGCGMDKATLAKIFDPFFTTKFTGRGLGLAAVIGIVRGHNGALKVGSEPGRGSSFRLLLPSAGGPPLQPELPFPEPPPSRVGLILLVDDEELILQTTRRMLEGFGYDVLIASNGVEALAHFRTSWARITAVVLDLTMPHKDGAEAFREMRDINPEVRVLLMSGFAEQQALARFAGEGLAGFIQKPFKVETLRDMLSNVIGAVRN